MHVPYTTLWDQLPENVKVAFSSSEEVCFELELLDQATLEELSSCRLIPEGGRIESQLPLELVRRVEQYLDRIKTVLPKWMGYRSSGRSSFLGGGSDDQLLQQVVGDWKRLRPVWLMFLLSSLKEEYIQHRLVPIMDTFLERGAQGLGKNVQAVENPEDQCRPFNKLLPQQVELALRVQLDYLESLAADEDFNGPESNLDEDVQSYQCGDFAHRINHTPVLPLPLDNLTATSPSLTEDELSMLRDTETTLYRQLVVRRNRKMAQRIGTLLNSNRTHTFFLGLGAGHFKTDRNSVIDRLRKKGFVVEHIPAGQSIDGPSLPKNFVALGDPNSVQQLLHVTEPTQPTPAKSITKLTDQMLEAIFQHVLSGISRQTRSTNQEKRVISARQSLSRLSEEEELKRWNLEVEELLEGVGDTRGGYVPRQGPSVDQDLANAATTLHLTTSSSLLTCFLALLALVLAPRVLL